MTTLLFALSQAARAMHHEAETLFLARVSSDGRRFNRERRKWRKLSLIFLEAARLELDRAQRHLGRPATDAT